ncbi:Hypothetical predicted protein [Octopus vulgaris]|uniref:Uncharacterized protein n=1 Tax=Octopus vulgaris TaxID=6645 RepID=A0AA36BBY3_OCTVU|nr:Hypothetical predicted protein [Octopus vulgaris]
MRVAPEPGLVQSHKIPPGCISVRIGNDVGSCLRGKIYSHCISHQGSYSLQQEESYPNNSLYLANSAHLRVTNRDFQWSFVWTFEIDILHADVSKTL